MKERPILFSGPMVRAILYGTKTQTRRVAKFFDVDAAMQFAPRFENGWWKAAAEGYECLCPYGQPGDRLWVKETFQTGEFAMNEPSGPVYRATDPDWSDCDEWKWKPSIFMSRALSRITLEIVSVRVERVQEISEEDALAEGSYLDRCPCLPRKRDRTPLDAMFIQTGCIDHGTEFKKLWDSINAKRGFGWAANPWVWVLEFQRMAKKEVQS